MSAEQGKHERRGLTRLMRFELALEEEEEEEAEEGEEEFPRQRRRERASHALDSIHGQSSA